MKTWNIHCSCRYTKDYVVEAETKHEAILKADAMFSEEDLENLEWIDDNSYDAWEVENEIQVGDFVTVTDCGYNYSTYYTFFKEHNLSIDVASRYDIGGSPIVNGRYKVLYIGDHELESQGKVYVIEGTEVHRLFNYVHLISKEGIEKVGE